jgi:hypothetical protein
LIENVLTLIATAIFILLITFVVAYRIKPGKWGARAIAWAGSMVFGALCISRFAESLSDWLFYVPLLGLTMGVFVLLGFRNVKWNHPNKGSA